MIMLARDGMRTVATRMGSAGFSLLELSVVLVIMGLMLSAAATAYVGMFGSNRSKLSADATLTTLSDAVVAFARTHNRLPCPDLDGAGNEGTAGACPTTAEVGWFPYLAAGLTNPAPAARAVYGVYRAAAADLAVASELSGDVAGSPTYADSSDFLHKLVAAAAQPVTNAHVYLTGDDGPAGAANCAANVVANPAFVVLLTGEDSDGDGNRGDAMHASLPAAGLCFAAPTRPASASYDDRTAATGFYALVANLER